MYPQAACPSHLYGPPCSHRRRRSLLISVKPSLNYRLAPVPFYSWEVYVCGFTYILKIEGQTHSVFARRVALLFRPRPVCAKTARHIPFRTPKQETFRLTRQLQGFTAHGDFPTRYFKFKKKYTMQIMRRVPERFINYIY